MKSSLFKTKKVEKSKHFADMNYFSFVKKDKLPKLSPIPRVFILKSFFYRFEIESQFDSINNSTYPF